MVILDQTVLEMCDLFKYDNKMVFRRTPTRIRSVDEIHSLVTVSKAVNISEIVLR